MATLITRHLVQTIRAQFELDWHGIHGASHWARVRENGLRLAESTGADTQVVELFSFLHDSRRRNDCHDPLHGHRAGAFVKSLVGTVLEIEPPRVELLVAACEGHSDGHLEGDITVLTCWDADRLDLGRVGIMPHPDRLCTDAARDPELLDWAYTRSIR